MIMNCHSICLKMLSIRALFQIIISKWGGDLIVGIIGAGKVGTTLGAYLCKNQIAVSGYYSRTFESAVSAADFTNKVAYHDIKELLDASDTLFITTPDAEIGHVWDCIVKYGLKNKIVCHFSGSLSSYVFSGIEAAGAVGCSIHPMFAFSDKFESYKFFSAACITIEGQEKAVYSMKTLFENLGHPVFTVKAEDKIRYHAAAALASNYMIGLFQTSLDLLETCGFSEEEGRMLLVPLVRNNVDSMLEKRAVEVLTGPVERGDVGTIEAHLNTLHGLDAENIYRSLGKELVAIARQKNPERDYTAVENLLGTE